MLRSERGQAMPLAAIGIFIMCLGVISTMNIGRAVHKRIKMQNTADSAAYSLAAAEARTFNYIAFLNRAQVAHYNTAMMVQSYVSYVGYVVALMGAAIDTLASLVSCIKTAATYCSSIEYYCQFEVMEPIADLWMTGVKAERTKLHKAYERVDSLGHEIVQAMAIFNKDVIFKAQLSRAALMNVQLLSGARAYIERMDSDMTLFSDKSAFLNTVVNAGLNSLEYYKAFDRSAGLNPMVPFVVTDYLALAKNDGWLKPGGGTDGFFGQVSGAAAYEVMSELANATRTPNFVFDRGTSTVGPSVLAASFGAS
ncbi:MAG: hypothetical protein JRH20_27185, partial [Deltaproteobacteria bacterium]|nr:hypothetical protein [Deltaproteobacteria bacterium]